MDAQQSIHKSVAVLIERGMPFERLQQASWINTIEDRLGFALPVALRALTTNYAFPAVSVGNVELFANLGDGSEDDLTVAPFKDPHLSKWFQANRRIQFARPVTGSYDPICLESRGKVSTAVEVFDHEDIFARPQESEGYCLVHISRGAASACCGLTNRSSGRVRDKVPSSYPGRARRSAQPLGLAMGSSPAALDRSEVETLLADLCVGYGFCLPSQEHDKLIANPPQEVSAFVDAVFIAEGLNPETASRSTYRSVRDRVAASFARSVEKAELDLALSRQRGSQ